MDRQLLSVLGIGVLVVLLVVGIFVAQSGWLSSQTGGRKAIADKHGWSYVENEDGTLWRMRGTHQGLEWVADAEKPRRDQPLAQGRPHKTRLVVRLAGGGVYVGPPIPAGFAGTVVRTLLDVTRPGAGAVVDTGRILPVPAPLQPTYQARITDDASWARLQGAPLAAFAETSKNRPWPVLLVWHEGELSLTAGEALVDPATVEGWIEGALRVVGSVSPR
jgi:hypothetical protein